MHLVRPAREIHLQNDRDFMEITQLYHKEEEGHVKRTDASDPPVPGSISSELSYRPIKEREPEWLSRFSDLAKD